MFSNIIRVSNNLESDQDQHFVECYQQMILAVTSCKDTSGFGLHCLLQISLIRARRHEKSIFE